MALNTLTILISCAIAAVALWIIGSMTLMVAVRMAKPEFRSKGFLRKPSGTRWFRFLMWKQYATFDNPSTRFLFGVTHFCVVATMVVLTAVILLLGQEFIMGGLSGVSFNSVPVLK